MNSSAEPLTRSLAAAGAAERMIAIETAGLSKAYHLYERPQDRLWQTLFRGRRQFYREFWALRDIDLSVRRGETVGIIGRNGSGKSTLLQLIAGTLSPTRGTVAVHGRLAALLELGTGFNPEFAGRENVFLYGAILGLSREEIAERLDAIVEFAGIGPFLDQPVKTYSSGMLIRLAFAVSVNIDPEILIVDEALAVGDAAFQFKCLRRLERLIENGTTLLFVSHDLGMVKAFCERAIYLTGGAMRAAGTSGEIAELYMADVKAEEQDEMRRSAAVRVKPAIGDSRGIAFGTDQGHIRAVRFAATGQAQALFESGDPVVVEVEGDISADVPDPSISLILCDHRMIEIGGRFFPLNGIRRTDGSFAVRFTLRPRLAGGQYYLTLRIEQRTIDGNLVPIDKQVAAANFVVLKPAQTRFMGITDLPIELEPLL